MSITDCWRCGAEPMEDQHGPAEDWCGCFEKEISPMTRRALERAITRRLAECYETTEMAFHLMVRAIANSMGMTNRQVLLLYWRGRP